VPSGWTTSGIDWTSPQTMRNSRTEDIVRELYMATLEREKWVAVTSGSRSVNYIPTITDFRVENCLRRIYDILKKWFTPLNEANTYLSGESAFIDPNSVPIQLPSNTNDLYRNYPYLGYDNYNYLQGGNLEALVGDLSIIRGEVSETRISLTELKRIYDILNLKLKNRAFSLNQYGHILQNLDYMSSSKQGSEYYQPDETGYPDSSTSVQRFYDSTDYTYDSYSPSFTGLVSSNWTRPFRGQDDYYITSQNYSGFKFDATGYDQTEYNIRQFDVTSYNYGYMQYDSDIFPVPTYPLGHSLVENKYVTVVYDPPSNLLSGEFALINPDFLNSGIPIFKPSYSGPRKVVNIHNCQGRPFIDLDKEGFLNYYTEEAN